MHHPAQDLSRKLLKTLQDLSGTLLKAPRDTSRLQDQPRPRQDIALQASRLIKIVSRPHALSLQASRPINCASRLRASSQILKFPSTAKTSQDSSISRLKMRVTSESGAARPQDARQKLASQHLNASLLQTFARRDLALSTNQIGRFLPEKPENSRLKTGAFLRMNEIHVGRFLWKTPLQGCFSREGSRRGRLEGWFNRLSPGEMSEGRIKRERSKESGIEVEEQLGIRDSGDKTYRDWHERPRATTSTCALHWNYPGISESQCRLALWFHVAGRLSSYYACPVLILDGPTGKYTGSGIASFPRLSTKHKPSPKAPRERIEPSYPPCTSQVRGRPESSGSITIENR
ncbi:hypothetical protein DFH08DRAFT_931250 [Mycena albidolilacea]|uniref:Uncharacterized protein n=1 Tax=Mycena albidolilacea TaxID=1033008 RepID=A0AAD7AJR6_9AGAR|nr:hypothetical protein DFH08DRAFT_931250 [Mycena albidolilacea]